MVAAVGGGDRVASYLKAATRSPAPRLIGVRLLTLIPVLFGVTFLSSALLNLLPGDAASELLGTDATPQSVHELTIALHLNEPFLVRYWHWLVGVLHGDLGTSLQTQLPVTTLLGRHLSVSLELLAYGFVVSIVIAVPVALTAAYRPGGVVDRLVTVFAMSGLSVASFVLGLLLVLVFADHWRLFPAFGWTPLSSGLGANLRDLTLPAIALGLPLGCFYTRVLRGDIVDQLAREDYIVAVRAKGVGRLGVLLRHALRNSLLGLITIIGINVGTLIGGTVLIEQIFSLPGIGSQLLTAIQDRDVPLVEGTVLVFAVAVVLANLVADLLLSVLDPRIRHGRSYA